MLGAFAARASAGGWTCYPESCGHDLVLVGQGRTVVVEGKQVPSLEVLFQALPPLPDQKNRDRADFYYVVVPRAPMEFREVAARLGIGVTIQRPPDPEGPNRGRWTREPTSDDTRCRWAPAEDLRCVGPGPRLRPVLLVPGVQAGSPAPRSVTEWKVAAVRLCLRALAGEEIRSRDIQKPLRPSLFVERGWLRQVGQEGRQRVYVLGDGPTRPDLVYPEIVAALRDAGPLEEGA